MRGQRSAHHGHSRVLVGEHRGVHRYTVGQRHGLGISANRRLYVLRLDPREQKVIVGDVEELDCGSARVDQVNWIAGHPPESKLRVRVQVRHRHRAAFAEVEAVGAEGATVRFEEPVRAVAPGQAAVFYEGDRVLGGGWIRRAAQSR